MKGSGAVGWVGERGLIVINGVILLLLCAFMFRPGGQGYQAVAGWIQERRLNSAITREWGALANGTSRVDSSGHEVLLVEFADYECPFCAQSEPEVEAFLADHPQVGVLYRHFPLRRIHPAAEGAARASVCAEAQGRFREMHRRLFHSSEWQSLRDWASEARSAGVPNLPEFATCLTSPSTTARLAVDESLAVRFAVRATPTFFTLSGTRAGAMSKSDIAAFLGERVLSSPKGASVAH
jgi:protein-disulfide isomerase